MKHVMTEDVQKQRRRFEDDLRKSLNLLISKGLHEEAEDLLFRLQRTLRTTIGSYLDENDKKSDL